MATSSLPVYAAVEKASRDRAACLVEQEIAQVALICEWGPSIYLGSHATFKTLMATPTKWSEYNAAYIYKWEGLITSGTHCGMIGVYVGESSRFRRRLEDYIYKRGDSGRIREDLLDNGDIKLYFLDLIEYSGADITRKLLDDRKARYHLEQALIEAEKRIQGMNRFVFNA
jgi:hypothetical protein